VIKFKPEFIETARPKFEYLVEHTRKEPGVLKYDSYLDANEEGVLLVIEKYINKEAFEAHCKSEHFLKVIAETKEWLLVPPQIRILKPEYVKN
jgi:quinol monooxygenase YgiN